MIKRLKVLKRGSGTDYVLLFAASFLVIFGLVALASASSYMAQTKFGDSYYYLKHQIFFGLSFGMLGLFLGMKIYYRYLEKLSVPIFIAGIALTLLVYSPYGLEAGGASRWLKLGSISFQPSEILKLVFIIYLAAWLSHDRERQSHVWRSFIAFLLILAGVILVLIKQPATSTAVILGTTALGMYYLSGTKLRYVAGVILVGILGLAVVIYLTPYRWNRVKSFLNPEQNLQTTGYQVNQAKIAIGSGGLLGVGYGQSTTKIKYLPEPIHDSIFAVIAEEFGFVGGVALITLLLVLILRMFIVAQQTRDKFGQLLLIGFGLLIALQSFVNIGAISGLLPLTGTPLPFISYGGTALAIFMTMIGIALNVARYS